MTDARKKVLSVIRLLRSSGPETHVSKLWLARTAGRLDRKFAASVSYSIRNHEQHTQIEIKDQVFLWPKESPLSGVLRILSELLTPMHPHQYLYGHTKVDKEDVVLDVGACEGAFAAMVTNRCARVVAIEPSQTMCALIPELFRLRGQPCPLILNCLLGSKSGSAYFLENKSNPGNSVIVGSASPGAYEIPVMTLDQVAEQLEDKPTFIKCDAEGAEPAIFSGGQKFLRKFRPKLAITTYHNDGDYAAMYSLLKSLGYNVEGKGLLFSPGGATLRVQMIHAW